MSIVHQKEGTIFREWFSKLTVCINNLDIPSFDNIFDNIYEHLDFKFKGIEQFLIGKNRTFTNILSALNEDRILGYFFDYIEKS